jgi:hypothetical protein
MRVKLLRDIHENEEAITVYEALAAAVGEERAAMIAPRPAPGKVRGQPMRPKGGGKRELAPYAAGLVLQVSDTTGAKWVERKWAEAVAEEVAEPTPAPEEDAEDADPKRKRR